MNLKREKSTANSSLLMLLTILPISACVSACSRCDDIIGSYDEDQETSDSIDLTAIIVSVTLTLVIAAVALLILCICLICNKWYVARDKRRTRQMAAMLEQHRAQRALARRSAAEAQPQSAGNTNTISAGSNPAENHNSDSQPQSSGTIHDPMLATSFTEGSGTTSLRQCQVTMPETERAICLPEATLHQGEEPPAYEEAIEMETVHLDDEGDCTSIGNQNRSSLQDRDLTK